MSNTESIISEFEQMGLTDVDTRRSAFCAVAYNRGWSAARIGRYLGISRARVGQKIDRLYVYDETHSMPLLHRLLTTATPACIAPDLPIGFVSSQWDDSEFALGILNQLAA